MTGATSGNQFHDAVNAHSAHPIPGVRWQGWFGFTVAGAGDVNADGFGDVVIGTWNMGQSAFLYVGGATGLTTPAASVMRGFATHFGSSVF